MDPLLATVAEEFDLGTPVRVDATPYGWDQVVRLTTERGVFIVKPARRVREVELYHQVERSLNARGIRQARIFLTSKGSPVGDTGHFVQEALPGTVHDELDDTRTAALLRHLADYDEALRDVAVPHDLTASDTIWTRVVRPDYLRARLPGLVERLGPTWLEPAPVTAALTRLASAAHRIAGLPAQLVHGDIGPDNVLYDGDDLVAVIDFTPFHAPRLFGVCAALYWCHLNRARPRPERVRPDFQSYGERSAWSELETDLLPVLLLREALRRLATPLAVADETGATWSDSALRRRYEALVSAVSLW